MIKIILGLILIFSTTLIGVKLAEKKKIKKNLYQELVLLCNKLKSDLCYKNHTLDTYLTELTPELKNTLNLNIENFIGGIPLDVKDKRLSVDEKNEIIEFFSELGKYDREGFMNMIDYYIEKFGKRYSDAENIYEKSKSFYLKMGVLVGTLLFVIII